MYISRNNETHYVYNKVADQIWYAQIKMGDEDSGYLKTSSGCRHYSNDDITIMNIRF